MRSRSRCQGERVGASGSGCSRPRLVSARTAYGRAGSMRAGLHRCAGGLQFRRRKALCYRAWNSSAVTDRAAAASPRSSPPEGTLGRRCASRCWPAGATGSSTASSWTTPPQDDDLVIERAGARVLVDPVSLDLLAGARARLHRRADGQPLRGAQPERQVGLRLRDQFLGRLNRGRRAPGDDRWSRRPRLAATCATRVRPTQTRSNSPACRHRMAC